ncbi:MAG: Gldg family protein [Gammaproteobacteria bacterium]
MNRRLLTSGGLILAAAFFVAINVIANGALTSWRLDMTESKLFTLSPGTRNILKALEEPITLRFYFSSKQFSGIPSLLNYGARVRDLLEEYAAGADGKLTLIVTDPEPFSEAEDQAVSYGIRQIPLGTTGDLAYFGLAGSNTTDDERTIAFFQPDEEKSLEYQMTQLIYNLAHPKDRVIGVISSLPLFGGPNVRGGFSEAWTVVDVLREEYEVRDLGTDATKVDKEVDTLMIVHPKELSEDTLYAIDQFVLKGGKALIFVDPLAEEDSERPDPHNPMAMPQRGSDLPELFKSWGVKYGTDKVVGDIEAAVRVAYSGGRGTQELPYLPWLRLGPSNFSQDDFTTNQLSVLHVGSAGILDKAEDAKIKFTPLVWTGKQSMALERDGIVFVRDPGGLLDSFKPEGKSFVLAARISGKISSAFPDGRPKKNKDDKPDADFVKESKDPINVVIVADSDLLADRFWVQSQDFLGVRLTSAMADNATFALNVVDLLGGDQDLISLRSRSAYARPFERVQAIEREAAGKFRAREQVLQAKLSETESKLRELQQKNDQGKGVILTPEQRKEIEKFREEQVQTRKELRAVQHDMRKHIEGLGILLKFINIALVPLLIAVFAISTAIYRLNRSAASAS